MRLLSMPSDIPIIAVICVPTTSGATIVYPNVPNFLIRLCARLLLFDFLSLISHWRTLLEKSTVINNVMMFPERPNINDQTKFAPPNIAIGMTYIASKNGIAETIKIVRYMIITVNINTSGILIIIQYDFIVIE